MSARPPGRRILLVMNDLGWAGAEKQLYYLARGLSQAGHGVRVVAIGPAMIDPRELVGPDVEVFCLGAESRASKLRAFPALVRHARWSQVVHCTGYDATLWGRLAAVLARRPALYTEHTPGRELQVSKRGQPRARAIAAHNRLLDRWTYAAVIVGRWHEELLISEGVDPAGIVHIPNAVPVAELRRAARRGPTRAELGIPSGATVLAHVAAFLPQKGQLTTLRAVRRLREEHGDVRALFIGGGRCEEEVRGEALRIGADWATFLGVRDDVAGLLQLADLCVLPSKGEGLPMVLIESEAIGTPVIATDVGDIGALIERTGGGICVPVGDDDAFVGACATVLSDPDLHERLSRAGMESIEAEYDAPRMTDRYGELFEAAVESAPRPLKLSG